MPPIDKLLSQYSEPVRSWPGEEWMDEEARANYAAANPAPPQQLRPDERYRGAFLPFRETTDGRHEWATPGLLQDVFDSARAVRDTSGLGLGPALPPSQMRQEEFDQVLGHGMAGAMTGVTGGLARAAVSPRLAAGEMELGAGGGRRTATEALPMDEASRLARAREMGFNTDQPWYHTTDKDFGAFKRRMNDVGVHFGTPGQAEDRISYLTSGGREARSVDGARTIPVYLRANRPLRLDDLGFWDAENLSFGLERAGFSKDEIQRAMRSSNSASGRLGALRDLIAGRGYDSIVYKNTGEVGGAAPLQAVRDAAWKEVAADQKARGKSPSSFDREDQMRPAYLAYKQAEEAAKAYREANAEDSMIALDTSGIRSINAAFDPRKRKSADLLASHRLPLPSLTDDERQPSLEDILSAYGKEQ